MTPTASIRILLIEDSILVRHGIRAAIESEPSGRRLEIVGEAATAAAGLAEARRLCPDVVLLDLRLPDESGLNICQRLRQLLPELCILVLTSASDSQSIYESVLAGVQGYLLKEIDPINLIQAIEDGHAGRPVFSGNVATSVLDIIREQGARSEVAPGLATLSPQEHRVLAAIAAGHSNKEIAELMGLSTNTVKNYIANLFHKLGVARRSQATALYLNSRPGKATLEPSR